MARFQLLFRLFNLLLGEKTFPLTAAVQVVYMIGWSPHSSQPQPKERGSAEVSLKDFGDRVGELPVA